MDIATFLGVIIGLGLVIVSILLGEGMAGFKPFLNYEAALIVLGGTVSAIFVNYPMSQVFGLFKVLKKVLTTTGEDTSEIVTTFVNFAKKGRTEGFLALEGDVSFLDAEVTGKTAESAWGSPIVTLQVRMTNQDGLLLTDGVVDVELPA